MSGARIALLAAAGLLVVGGTSAQAADLGGDCCADLEERIAELEATTARKGNRKVSLEISGHINEAVMWWDDGSESNTYVVTNDSGRSRVRFKGKAKIDKDWEAGYYLELGFRSPRSDRVDQGGDGFDGDDPEATIDVRQSNWYIKNASLGEVRIGFGDGATESITELNITQTKDIAKNSDVEDHASGFQLRAAGGGLSALEWRRLVKDDFIQPGEGSRGNYVLYRSPEFAGFTASAAWGEDDFWDIALRYHGELAGIKIAAGFGYGENTDDTSATMPCMITTAAECHQFGGSISALHESSGLFVTFGAGKFVDERIGEFFAGQAGPNTNADDESTFYAFQAGIEKKWLPLGKTTLYGEYFHHDGGANDRGVGAADAISPAGFVNASRIFDSEVETIGGGVIQGIDSAAMSVYLLYRHYEGDVTFRENTTGNLASTPLEDLDVVMGGALIKF
jgi:hypothetical protein